MPYDATKNGRHMTFNGRQLTFVSHKALASLLDTLIRSYEDLEALLKPNPRRRISSRANDGHTAQPRDAGRLFL